MKLTIIIPVYNEEQTIEDLFKKVWNVSIPNVEKEIIIVDDGSTDSSTNLIKKLQSQYSGVKVYVSAINLGKGAAIRLGLTIASGDIILIQDADLELEPKEYRKLIAPITQGKSRVMYGSRFSKMSANIPFKTILANKFLTGLTNLLYRSHLTDMETAYKVFTADVINELYLRCVEFDFEPEVTAKILQLGYSIHEIPIRYKPRRHDEGKKISFYDGIEAVYQLVKNWFFPRPTRFRQWSLLDRKSKTLTFPFRILCKQEWLKKMRFTTLEDERIHYVLPHVRGMLLDIGCGENNLVKKWGNGIGVDTYPWDGVDYVCDTTKLPFQNAKFDTVSFLASLNHIPKRLLVLKEVARVLKPNGKIIITMINERVGWLCHKITWWYKHQHERGMERGGRFGLNDTYLKRLLHQSGFEIVAKKKFSFLGLNTLYVAVKTSPR
ncbi:MAG: glycosyltransferase [Candidatus Levybacteria bacterium]|nr:glycosyltransferase [Candidatus Levybacteria bacterium]